MRGKWLFIVPLAIVGMALFVTIGGYGVMWLWNRILPPLFGWHVITFGQALGLLVLCRVLFGGLGLHGGNRSALRRNMADRVADRFVDRWEHMSPEERERFRQRIRERFGLDPTSGPTATA
ncbi:MAG: hypothetical protein HYR74_04920 [Candidatus Eisenbacteria bacterium]|nr:hypothetical protein [Candidatus Eisenbacteria bacterium]